MNTNPKTLFSRVVSLSAAVPIAALGLLSGATVNAQGQEEAPAGIFEEIVVLATKRAENILDVPVAVSALTGDQIVNAGIKDVWDLQQNVPGLIVGRSQTSTTSNFSIRSIGSTSNNFGVESSVGLYVDGVYRSRQSSMINDLIDVEAVEVLRGPQGTLFGKNTAAGAISVRTARPGREQNAFVDVTMGDFGLTKVSAAANIPIGDNMAFRGTIFSSQRDGIVDDVNLGDDLYNDRDRIGARLQLAVNDIDDEFNMRIVADYSEIDETCCVALTNVDSLYMKGALPGVLSGQIDPFDAIGSDAAAALLGGTVFPTFNYPQPLIDGIAGMAPGTILAGSSFEDYKTALNTEPVSTNEDMGLSLEINKDISDSVTLKSITAVRNFETYDDIDADFSDVDLIGRTNTAEQSSFSQEFQFTGEFGEGSSWVAGAYYFTQEIDSTTLTTADSQLNTFAKIGSGTYIDSGTGQPVINPSTGQPFNNIDFLLAGVDQLDAGLEQAGLGALLNPSAQPYPGGSGAFDDVRQDHDGFAVFGQVDWSITDSFKLSLGARYTDETKDIDATYTSTANGPPPNTAAIQGCLLAAGGFLQSGGAVGSLDCLSTGGLVGGDLASVTEPSQAWGLWEFVPFRPRSDVQDTLKDDQTTGTVKLTYFPSDSTMVYASYSTGFKAGGTNSDRVDELNNIPQIFDAETSASTELGLKGQYGPVQVVATVYQTDFDDFQANSFAGGGFILRNAGDLSIEGVELELLWRPTDSTEISAWYAHNEGTFDSFEEGVGWDAWVLQNGVWQNPPQGDPGCSGVPDPSNLPETCSRSGDKLPYNPEDRLFVSIQQDFHLSNSTSAFARLEYTYTSDQTTDGDNDPLTVMDDFKIINVRLGFNFDDYNASLVLWGRNITDERYYYGSFDVPFSYDKTFSYPGEPATYGVTFRKGFD